MSNFQPVDYTPSCYEQIVIDRLENKDIQFDTYKEEFKNRNQGIEEFKAYVKHVDLCLGLVNNSDFNLKNAINTVKKENPISEKIPTFNFTDEEKKTILKAEDLGRIKAGEIIKYDGYDREIRGVDSQNLPKEVDAFVIFSGHPGTAEQAIKTWFKDVKNTGKPKKLIFLGLYDNQGNTDFSQGQYKFNSGSEMRMYRKCFEACGVSQEIIDECIMTATDISTEENISLLAETRNKYFDQKKEANFVMFGYPSYQKRIASEFSFGFQKLADEQKVFPTNFYIPDTPPLQEANKRYLSYDNLDTIGPDIIIGNCVAHPFRLSAGGRFDSKLGKYPQEFKHLLPMSLVYSYPNVANELAGTNTKVATVMKLVRATQHETYEWEKAKNIDNSISYNMLHTKRDLALRGLVSDDLIKNGNKLSKKEYLKALMGFQKDKTKDVYEEGAKTLLGQESSKKIVQTVAKFLKGR